MYFKVDRKVLKKALILLKQKQLDNKSPASIVDGEVKISEYFLTLAGYISKIEFALYKTRINEFYIDYEFAQEIRPALLTKKEIKK